MAIIKIDREFQDICDSFIDLSNTYSNTVDYQKVSVALLHAAARFNAFSIWANADNIAEFKSEKDINRNNFCDEYKKLITENLNDFEANFDTHRIESKL